MLSAAGRVEEAFFDEWEHFTGEFDLCERDDCRQRADQVTELVEATDLRGVGTGHCEPIEQALIRLGLHPTH